MYFVKEELIKKYLVQQSAELFWLTKMFINIIIINKKKGMNKMTEKINFENLVNKLFQLEEGIYIDKNGIEININHNKEKNISKAFIQNDGIVYEITNLCDIEQVVSIQIDINSSFSYKESSDKKKYKNFFTVDNDHKYHIYENGIIRDNESFYLKKGDTLIRKIDDNFYLGYCYNNKNVYVHYKKHDIKKETEDINDDLFIHIRIIYDFQLTKLLNNIKQNFNGSNFNELSKFLSFPELTYSLFQEIEAIKETATVYNRYHDKIDIEQYEAGIGDIYELVNKLLNIQMKPTESTMEKDRSKSKKKIK